MISPASTLRLRGGIAVVLAAVAIAASARTDNLSRSAGGWLEYYYQQPNPDQFVTAVFALSRNNYFALPDNVPVGIGFFASVFRQNPDSIDEWMTYSRLLPERERRLMICALWSAGHPKGASYLAYYATEIVGEELGAKLIEVMERSPKLDDPEIHSSRDAYLKWGVYLATGDEAVLRTIMEAMATRDDLTLQDRWWLAVAASRHEQVMAFCQREIATPDSPLRDLMQLVVTAQSASPTG